MKLADFAKLFGVAGAGRDGDRRTAVMLALAVADLVELIEEPLLVRRRDPGTDGPHVDLELPRVSDPASMRIPSRSVNFSEESRGSAVSTPRLIPAAMLKTRAESHPTGL